MSSPLANWGRSSRPGPCFGLGSVQAPVATGQAGPGRSGCGARGGSLRAAALALGMLFSCAVTFAAEPAETSQALLARAREVIEAGRLVSLGVRDLPVTAAKALPELASSSKDRSLATSAKPCRQQLPLGGTI